MKSCAKEILRLNGTREEEFVGAVNLSLQHGRGKFRNSMIVGPTNCAKTFILKPLTTMYSDGLQGFRLPTLHVFWSRETPVIRVQGTKRISRYWLLKNTECRETRRQFSSYFLRIFQPFYFIFIVAMTITMERKHGVERRQ